MKGTMRAVVCAMLAVSLFACGSKEVVMERTPEENARMDQMRKQMQSMPALPGLPTPGQQQGEGQPQQAPAAPAPQAQ